MHRCTEKAAVFANFSIPGINASVNIIVANPKLYFDRWRWSRNNSNIDYPPGRGGGEGVGGEEDETVSGRTRVLPASMHVEMRSLFSLQTRSRACSSRNARDHRVLPGSMALQVWTQTLHAISHKP